MLVKKYFIKSVNRITKDFKQKELLPLKLVFFVQASTISVLYPYLTIHMRELGINVEEAAIMSAVIPVIGIIMPPLAGMVADKIGNFKLLLAFFSLIGGAASLLLLLVPVGRITVTYPERVVLDFGCEGPDHGIAGNSSKHFQVGFWPVVACQHTSEFISSNYIDFNVDTKLEACGFVCRYENQSIEPENIESDVILKGRSYRIQIQSGDATSIHHYEIEKGDVPKSPTKEEILSKRIMSNMEHLRKSIRKVGPGEYFFPAVDASILFCRTNLTEPEGTWKRQASEPQICSIEAPEEDTKDFLSTVNVTLQFDLRKEEEVKGFNSFKSESARLLSFDKIDQEVVCEKGRTEGRDISTFVHIHNPENNLEVVETLKLYNCTRRCLVSAPRKNLCTNLKEEVLYDPQLTFWVYLIIRVFIGIIGSTSYAMYEVAVIAILREQKADYGLQRIYASIGGMISSPLSGLLIDYASQGKGYTDFRPAFYLYAGLKIGTSVLMLFINLEFKKAASNVISDAIQVLKNLEVIALLTACFVLGTAWGYIESFLFWFLEDLGGTRSLMGITITVGGIAGIPLLVLSGPIIDKIGHANVLFIGFLFYAIRLVGYSIIYNPYHCLFFEAMESITSSLAITAAVTYAAKLSTTTTDGSIQGLVGGLYFGVGRGAGSLIGGYLMKAFGTRPTYRIFAVFSMITGVAYYLFNQFYIRKRPQIEGNDICKKESKPKKNLDPEIQIITDKHKMGSKEYEDTEGENNNTTAPMETSNSNQKAKEDKEKEQERDSHSNPGFVNDEEAHLEKSQDEPTKKEV